MEHCSYLSLFLILQIQKLRLMVRDVVLRIIVIQFLNTEMMRHRLDSRSRAVLFALEGISCDMRSRHINQFYQILIHIRLIVPGVDYCCSQFRISRFQSILVHDLTSGSVNEYGSWLHQHEELLVGHSACGIIQRSVHGHDLRICKKIFQRAESLLPFRSRTWRIATQHIVSKISGHMLDLASHMADPDDSEVGTVQFYVLARGHAIKCREHILHHATCVTAFSIVDFDSVTGTIIKVYMVRAYGGCRYQLHLRAVQKVCIALCTGSDDKCISVYDIIMIYLTSVNIYNLGIWFKYAFQKRNMLVCNYFHSYPYYFKTMLFTAGPPLGSATNRLSAARNSFIFCIITSRW